MSVNIWNMLDGRRVVLASASPRRRELMKLLTDDFEIMPADIDESAEGCGAFEAAEMIARRKCMCIAKKLDSDAIVIGCDTVVDLDGVMLGKPGTADEAAEMIRSLSGRTHLVHTGYAVVSQCFVDVGVETTQVTFRKLTDEDVAVYVASGAPMDKAGAYGIQETDFVSDVVGSYDNVIGFPTEQINRLLIACGAVLQK